MLFLQMHDAAITHLAAAVDQAPLRIEDRRLRGAGVESGNGQQHLHIRGKPAGAGARTTR